MIRSLTLVALATLTAGSTAWAQRPPQPEPEGFERFLFAPELVMQQRRRLDLTAAQRTAITQAIQSLQARVLELQWQMEDEMHQLEQIVAADRVDADAALAQMDRVLAVEDRIKRAHLEMLVRIKNTLTVEQQRILRN